MQLIYFTLQGSARTLAGGEASAAAPAADAAVAGPSPIVHTITFYANGLFTVNDGAATRQGT